MVCDPPYGVRAGGRKSQSLPDRRIKDRTTHISATAPYFLGAHHLPPCHSLLLMFVQRLVVQHPGKFAWEMTSSKRDFRMSSLSTWDSCLVLALRPDSHGSFWCLPGFLWPHLATAL